MRTIRFPRRISASGLLCLTKSVSRFKLSLNARRYEIGWSGFASHHCKSSYRLRTSVNVSASSWKFGRNTAFVSPSMFQVTVRLGPASVCSMVSRKLRSANLQPHESAAAIVLVFLDFTGFSLSRMKSMVCPIFIVISLRSPAGVISWRLGSRSRCTRIFQSLRCSEIS